MGAAGELGGAAGRPDADWLVPDWPAPATVQALCTTRHGRPAAGASLPPYDDFNLGEHVGDAPAAVQANRAALARRIGVRPVYLTQVHGRRVLPLDARTPDGSEADACVSTQPGVACTILIADCLPVLFTAADGRAVGAAHAGWRGLAGGVLEATLAGFRVPDVLAWLGPCIGPQAFEVGPEVRQAFMAQDPDCEPLFVPLGHSKYLADLPALARRRLAAAGVSRIYGNDGGLPWCTVANPSRFFSHRRDRVSGRMAACIWLS